MVSRRRQTTQTEAPVQSISGFSIRPATRRPLQPLLGVCGLTDAGYIGCMGSGWTYQSLVDAWIEVTVFCNNLPAIKHVLDLVKLRDRFGPDALAMEDQAKASLQEVQRERLA